MDTATSWDIAVHTHYNRFIATALLIWDIFITFDDEVRLFWQKPWSGATWLFLTARYVGLAISIFGIFAIFYVSSNVCSWWLRVEGLCNLIIMWSVMTILQLRLFGLYDKSRSFGIVLGVGFVLQAALSCTVFAFAFRYIKVDPDSLQGLDRCYSSVVPHYMPLYFAPPITFESILCLLALKKAWERFRETRTTIFSGKSLFDILIRDSVGYYIVILSTYAVNVRQWQTSLPDGLDLWTPFIISIPSVIGARLMLNVRIAYYDAHFATPRGPSDISLEIPNIESISLQPIPSRSHVIASSSNARTSPTGRHTSRCTQSSNRVMDNSDGGGIPRRISIISTSMVSSARPPRSSMLDSNDDFVVT